MNTEETITGRRDETKLLFELNIPGKDIGFKKTKRKYNSPFCKKVRPKTFNEVPTGHLEELPFFKLIQPYILGDRRDGAKHLLHFPT